MHKLHRLIFIIIILYDVWHNACCQVSWMTSSTELDYKFMESIINFKNTDSCEELEQNKKIAICEYILTHPKVFTKYDQRVYLNRNAFFHTQHLNTCFNSILSFENETKYNNIEIQKKLFPCYGRHDPMRTEWYIDDAFKYFYVHVSKSVSSEYEYYVFRYDKHFVSSGDRFVLVYGIKNLNIYGLITPQIDDYYLTEDNKLLKYISRNMATEQIEINYFREADENETSICDLPVQQKMKVCKTIMSHPNTPLRFGTALQESVFTDESTKCILRYLKFQHASKRGFVPGFEQKKMFSCHSTYDQNHWYLADGYRNSSVIVFMKYYREVSDDVSTVQVYELYENFTMDNIEQLNES